jgi:hypothetical protein
MWAYNRAGKGTIHLEEGTDPIPEFQLHHRAGWTSCREFLALHAR